MAAASLVLVAGAVISLSPRAADRPRAVLVTRDNAGTFGGTVVATPSPAPAAALTPIPVGWWTDPAQRQLTLPGDVAGVDLAAIPDRLLNDPPAARLRVPVQVRGTSGIASVDPPFEVAWSESGFWYWMRSGHLTVAQLVELASTLR